MVTRLTPWTPASTVVVVCCIFAVNMQSPYRVYWIPHSRLTICLTMVYALLLTLKQKSLRSPLLQSLSPCSVGFFLWWEFDGNGSARSPKLYGRWLYSHWRWRTNHFEMNNRMCRDWIMGVLKWRYDLKIGRNMSQDVHDQNKSMKSVSKQRRDLEEW